MPSCTICLDDLKSPLSLPCGHVFCSECLIRAVNAVRPYTSLHFCPTCRSVYSIVGVNPAVVPQQLRQHIVPSVRRIFLDESSSTSTTPATQPRVAVAECGRLTAENTSLRVHCALWRKRAEVHAAATLGLLNLARTANIQAEKMKQERDELQRQCRILKRKLDAEEAFSSVSRSVSPQTQCKPPSSESIPISSFFNLDHEGGPPSHLHCVQCAERWLGLSVCPHTQPEPLVPQSRPLEDGSLPPSLKRRKVEDTGSNRSQPSRASFIS